MSVFVLTTDPLPLPGLAATGAGLRAWSLAEGLNCAGVEARALMPAALLEGRLEAARGSSSRHLFPESDLERFLERESPSCIVAQHWGMAARLPRELPCPLAIDLAGPHLLERRHWGQRDLAPDIEEKIETLARADFAICSGRDQRLYFLPWLALAGFDPGDPDLCPALPFAWSPNPPPHAPQGQPRRDPLFVSGGVLLPWQNPMPALEALLRAMDEAGRGRLRFFGGAHPALNVAGGESQALLAMLDGHPRAEVRPLQPFERFLDELARADAAFDVLPRNNERELAFPIRTTMYLWSGLPVLHGDYDELARWIGRYGAGWTVNPADPHAIFEAALEAVSDPRALAARAEGARRMARERLTWDNAIEPLARFCRAPFVREKRPGAGAAGGAMRAIALERQLAETRAELAGLQGKWPMRWARRAKRLAWLGAPVVFLLGLAGALAAWAGALGADRLPPRSPGQR